MEPFTVNPVCKKCGSISHQLVYQPPRDRQPQEDWLDRLTPHEHLQVVCPACEHRWAMTCKDA